VPEFDYDIEEWFASQPEPINSNDTYPVLDEDFDQ